MSKRKIVAILGIALALIMASGCKVAVIVVEGGAVYPERSGGCYSGTICLYQVNDTNYSERFTAVADYRWEFKGWQNGDGFICQAEPSATCLVSNAGSAGDEFSEAIIASETTFHLMPVFERVTPEPITDTVIVDGREWAQVSLFEGTGLEIIKEACPNTVCSGLLNSFEMAGWTWASMSDVNALFNHYIGFEAVMLQDPELIVSHGEVNSTWAPAFYADGWKHTEGGPEFGYRSTSGFAYRADYYRNSGHLRDLEPDFGTALDAVITGGAALGAESGGWFYRDL